MKSQVVSVFSVLVVAGIPVTALSPGILSGLSPGVALSVLAVFTTYLETRRYRFVLLAIAIISACVVSGLVLTAISRSDHLISTHTAVAYISELIFAATSILSILWSRTRVGVAWTAAAYALGMIVQQALTPDAWSTNAWKYAFAWPTSVLVLALVHKANKKLLTILLLGSLSYVSMLNDYRSFFGFCLLVAIVSFWSSIRRNSKRSSVPFFVGLVALGFVIYQSAIWLALKGYLGNRNQTVTMEQIESSGSALAGARSEIFAAIPLFIHRPIGYGPGVSPNSTDIQLGLNGLASAGAEIHLDYVYGYMFGDVFKLHSIASDLWVLYGLAGLLLAIVFAVAMLDGIALRIRRNETSGLLLLLAITGLWNLGLSPIGSNLDELILSVALLVQAQNTTQSLGRRSRPSDGYQNMQRAS